MGVTKTIFILKYEGENFISETKWYIVRRTCISFNKYRLENVFNAC